MTGWMLLTTPRIGKLRLSGALARLSVVLVLLATVVKASDLGSLFWLQADMAAMLILIAATIIYLPACLSSARYWPAFWMGVAILALFVFAHVGFVRRSGMGYNFNAIFAYFPALTFLPFIRSRVTIDRTLYYLAWISAGYIVFFTLGYEWIIAAAKEVDSHILKMGDYQRGLRVMFAPAFAAYAFFFMWEWRRGNILFRSIVMAMSIWAIWLSDYRTFLALFLLVCILRAFRSLNLLVRIGIFITIIVGYAILLAGLIIPQWEPFSYFMDDASGFARLLAYRHVSPFVTDNWLLGIGIAGSSADLQAYLRVPTYYSVYPTDLGPIGPLLIYGIGGLCIYIVLTACMIIARLPMRSGARTPGRMALHLTSLVCAVQGLISPSFMLENNVLFPALLFSGWVQLRQMRNRRRDYNAILG
ncbi:hypothetical protein [Sphingobium aromaticiconvertens]|uniref:hypothetical protein n=1 Tax=Sphingobium aromaticiconvertens TaxID=365341 RepID=UPI00301811B8